MTGKYSTHLPTDEHICYRFTFCNKLCSINTFYMCVGKHHHICTQKKMLITGLLHDRECFNLHLLMEWLNILLCLLAFCNFFPLKCFIIFLNHFPLVFIPSALHYKSAAVQHLNRNFNRYLCI